jgi:hypothetical protein
MSDFQFEGFEPANTTPVPDILFDRLLKHLSGAELKVLLYIIRRTWGFKKDTDAISLSQFQNGITTKDGRVLDEGCGVKDKKTIIAAQESLETKGIIYSEKTKTDNGDYATTVYRVRFRAQGVVEKSNHPTQKGSGKIQPPRSGEIPLPGSGKIQPRVVGKSNLQETVIQQTELQETVIQESNTSDDATTHKSSLSLSTEEIIALAESRGLKVSSPEQSVVPPTQDTPAPAQITEPSQEISAQKKPTSKKTAESRIARSNTKPATPVVEMQIVLTEREQSVYDEWVKMPWFNGVPPKITETVRNHCKTLAAYNPLPTAEDMLKTRHYAEANRQYKGKGWQLGNVVVEYPNWKSSQYKAPAPAPIDTNVTPIRRTLTPMEQRNRELKAKYGKLKA